MTGISPRVSIVVAMATNRIIGRDNGLPWRLSSDLKRFKAITMGNPVVMGRKTFDSIGKPLPGRLNIVISRNYDWAADGVVRVGSLDAALELAAAHLESAAEEDEGDGDARRPGEIFIIGGGEIFIQAMALADRLYVTHVLGEIEGDTVFPEIDPAVWEEVSGEDVPAGEKDSHPTRFAVYDRRAR